jgi:hypothetical protein
MTKTLNYKFDFRKFIILLLLILGISYLFNCAAQETKNSPTTVQITNSNSDSVLVFLRLGVSDTSWVHDVNGIFGIHSSVTTQGSFWLQPNDTLSYTSTKPIQGNISFWHEPNNCPYPDSAITLYEFTLNNLGTVVNAQETVDISCVAGVSSIGSITMQGGGQWTDNFHPDSITKIQNSTLYNNSNTSGVFPYGCTNCINHDGAPDCEGHPKYATENTHNICNVQRNASLSGGIVTITYIKKN